MTQPVYIPGVDEPLPEGERLLWQGRPDARALARHAFRVRWLGGYFVALALLALVFGDAGTALPRATWLLLLGGVTVGMVYGYATLTARESVYAITDRRVVMRVGVAFPSVFNLPLGMVGEAAVREYPDGTGDLAVEISGSDRIGYLFMWPHVRPRYLRNPQPMLRGLPRAAEVARLFKEAAEAAPRPAAQDAPPKKVHYAVMDDDGIEVLSNRATRRQVQGT